MICIRDNVVEGEGTEIRVTEAQLKWWKENLPAMVEQCRASARLEDVNILRVGESHYSAAVAKKN